jgi:hypothetical protein
MAVPGGINYPSVVGNTNNSTNQHQIPMKTTIVSLLSLSAFSLLSSCTFVDQPEPATHTTRTTTSEVSPTTYGTVETKTTRSY